jgi:hypothetical protein
MNEEIVFVALGFGFIGALVFFGWLISQLPV